MTTANSNNPALAAYLEMVGKVTRDDIKKWVGEILIDEQTLVEPLNGSEDASRYLNENRKPHPEAQRISDALKASHVHAVTQ